MKVIFIKNLKGQGTVDDVKEVKDGYALNFLIKRGYAIKLTETSNKILTKDIENKKQEKLAKETKAKEIKLDLEVNEYNILVKEGKNGKIFGTITSKNVTDILKEKGFKIDKKNIVFEEHIKVIGQHVVKIVLTNSVFAKIKLNVLGK